MLTEDDRSLTLTADSGRSANLRRLLGALAAVCAALGVLALLPLTTAVLRGAAIDGAVIGVLLLGFACWVFAWFCFAGVRRFRQIEQHGLILRVEKDVIVTASGSIPASDVHTAHVRWRSFSLRTRHPVTAMLERWTGAGAHRTIRFTRADGATEDVYISLFATDDEFGRVADRLVRMLTEHGVPVQRLS